MRTSDSKQGRARATASRHLFEAIELVRADVAKVEFWANAVEQFAQPAPDYDLDDDLGWVPPEEGAVIKRRDH